MPRIRIWMLMLAVAVVAIWLHLDKRWRGFAREAEEAESWAAGYERTAQASDKGRVAFLIEAAAWEADIGEPERSDSVGNVVLVRRMTVDDEYRRSRADELMKEAMAPIWDTGEYWRLYREADSRARKARSRW